MKDHETFNTDFNYPHVHELTCMCSFLNDKSQGQNLGNFDEILDELPTHPAVLHGSESDGKKL